MYAIFHEIVYYVVSVQTRLVQDCRSWSEIPVSFILYLENRQETVNQFNKQLAQAVYREDGKVVQFRAAWSAWEGESKIGSTNHYVYRVFCPVWDSGAKEEEKDEVPF